MTAAAVVTIGTPKEVFSHQPGACSGVGLDLPPITQLTGVSASTEAWKYGETILVNRRGRREPQRLCEEKGMLNSRIIFMNERITADD